jgi:hypothetical protein
MCPNFCFGAKIIEGFWGKGEEDGWRTDKTNTITVLWVFFWRIQRGGSMKKRVVAYNVSSSGYRLV